MKTINCNVVDCESHQKKILIKDFCKAAVPFPVEAKDIPIILGPDVLHWRINGTKVTMTEYLVDRTLGDAIKVSAPPVQAKLDDIKALLVIGLKSASGQVSQHWV